MTKTLVLELWGVGDAVLMTSLLRSLEPTERRITVLAKPLVGRLLGPSYSQVNFVPYLAPWTAFRGKYRLSRWDWAELGRLLAFLRGERFDEALSARHDPRDHLLMALTGARVRCGFSRLGSCLLLNAPVEAGALRHRVEDWQHLARRLAGSELPMRPPWIDANAHRWGVPEDLRDAELPILVIHFGAAQSVRRWPLRHWMELVDQLRRRYAFHLAAIPDPDGFGEDLRVSADSWHPSLSIEGLVAVLRSASLFLGNDSGPGHLASAMGVPTIALFGPQRPELFAPWGPHAAAVSRDLCANRPCKDRCRHVEPYCLTRLTPDEVISDVSAHLAARDRGSSGFAVGIPRTRLASSL